MVAAPRNDLQCLHSIFILFTLKCVELVRRNANTKRKKEKTKRLNAKIKMYRKIQNIYKKIYAKYTGNVHKYIRISTHTHK